jgi:transcription-repair coupling factor (superfamily II helicase)
MRGAGELLGTRQHGFIAAVGFQLYTRLLAQAVRHLRKMTGLQGPEKSLAELKDISQPVNVDLPLPVGIPQEYVADQNMRLRLYRRIANLNDETEIQAISDEFNDRFGAIPDDLANLLYQVRVKLKAEAAGLVSIALEGEQVVLRYPPLPETMPQRVLKGVGGLARVGKNAYWMPIKQDGDDWQERLLELLDCII